MEELPTRDELRELAERHEMAVNTEGLTMELTERDMEMIIYSLRYTAKFDVLR